MIFWSKKQFLLTVSQKWMQNSPGLDLGWVGLAGLGRAGWAGLAGWLGWLAGLPGLACWAGWAGPGWAGTLPGIGFVDFWPESHQIELPGSGFLDFWSQRQKVFKSSFLGFVLSASGAKARKSSNQASWDRFS